VPKDKIAELIDANLQVNEEINFHDEGDQEQLQKDDTRRLKNAKWIPIDKIRPDPNQPRRVFNEASINELAQSIKDYGLRQPIVVERDEEKGLFRIVSGERRYRASKRIGLRDMPCIVQDQAEGALRFVQQLIENIHREDLTPVDKARALLEFRQILGERISWSDVERKVGISESRRKQFVRLLNLPVSIQSEIVSMGKRRSENQVTEKHARALLMLNKMPGKQAELFNSIKSGTSTISGDEAIAIAKGIKGEKRKKVFRISYLTTEELISKLQESLRKLQRNVGGT
jgi:ParB family chromosome partitioning protein